MRPIHLIVLPVLVIAVAAACDDSAPWGQTQESAEAEPPHDFGPTAAYSRRLIFLGPGEPLPTTAVFDFSALSDSASVRRGVRARLLMEDEWMALMDAGWESDPMREPWRLVPGGPLKLVVDEAGEIAAIGHRGDPEVRLEPGAVIAESSPDAGTQFVLRQASLDIDSESIRGILLDAQLGRAVSPAAMPRDPTPAHEADRDEDPTTADDAGYPRPQESLATPIARPGTEAFLVNNSGYYAVFARSASGEVGWISFAGQDDIQRDVGLEPMEWSPSDDEETPGMPTLWRISGPESQLAGELHAAATDPAALPDLADVTALGYILVSGWIEDGGVRRDVFGVVRQVR